jgi:hypothetical protein
MNSLDSVRPIVHTDTLLKLPTMRIRVRDRDRTIQLVVGYNGSNNPQVRYSILSYSNKAARDVMMFATRPMVNASGQASNRII